ncbi:MAG TPA: DUF423 domain-containing protein [Bacteroidia bacterium]|nr:DUF423 domain-containing protein [Bacteroidia bacterium]HRH07779.1 DUF423 domain-containing protein [Bacteroidia bacterium]HRH63236.1 DUF423 domain-containing protein [Bacteroidia bacterium]
MLKTSLIIAASLALCSVCLGAFGAHTLKPLLSSEQLLSYETAVRYQMYHSLAALLVLSFYERLNKKQVVRISQLFFLGILLFSGSIYLLSCRDLLGISNYKWLGPITPIGGMVFMAGWIYLIFAFSKIKTAAE